MGSICSNSQSKQEKSKTDNSAKPMVNQESPSSKEPSVARLVRKRISFVQVSEITIKDDIKQYYNILGNVGKGSFGIVRECEEVSTKKKFAVKTLTKSQFPRDKIQFLQREIEIVSEVSHDNIIKCHKVFEDVNFVHFIFDYVQGGDLFDYIINQDEHHLSEQRTCQIFTQMLSALHYLSSISVIHRDIKLENFLLMQEDSNLKVLLIDFGFAIKLNEGEMATERVGSLNYMSPEILQQKPYNESSDMWSIGVVLYNMLSGKQPFSGDDEKTVTNKIIGEDIEFHYEIWSQVSLESKNLIRGLLNKKAEDRLTAWAAKQHQWIQTFNKNADEPTVAYTFKPKPDLINGIIQSLNKQTNLKNAVWNAILLHMEIKEASKCSTYIKENNKVSNALSQFMVNYEVFLNAILVNTSSEILKDKIHDILNKNPEQCKKQMLDYWETLNSFDSFKDAMLTEKIWNIFKNEDLTNEGIISVEIAHKLLKDNNRNISLNTIVDHLSSKNSKSLKVIDYENFEYLWKLELN